MTRMELAIFPVLPCTLKVCGDLRDIVDRLCYMDCSGNYVRYMFVDYLFVYDGVEDLETEQLHICNVDNIAETYVFLSQ